MIQTVRVHSRFSKTINQIQTFSQLIPNIYNDVLRSNGGLWNWNVDLTIAKRFRNLRNDWSLCSNFSLADYKDLPESFLLLFWEYCSRLPELYPLDILRSVKSLTSNGIDKRENVKLEDDRDESSIYTRPMPTTWGKRLEKTTVTKVNSYQYQEKLEKWVVLSQMKINRIVVRSFHASGELAEACKSLSCQ